MSHARPTRWATRGRRRLVVLMSLLGVVLLVATAIAARVLHRGGGSRDEVSASSTARAPAPGIPSATAGPPVLAKRAYLGAWVMPSPFTQRGRIAATRRFEAAAQHRLDFVHLYRRFGMRIGTPSDLAYARSGKYLLISWPGIDSRRIASGAVDSVLRRTAREVGALPTKVFFEYRWEMDRPNLRSVVHDPAAYIAAWNHLRDVFASERVSNVAWTWCPTAGGFGAAVAQRYYPGDSRVDWICADVYPTAPWRVNGYEPFPALAAPFMTWASRRPKPIIVGELAVGRSYGSRRAEWIRQAGQYIATHPRIKAVAWFEQSLPTDPSYYQWALEGDPPALKAFAAFANSGYFGR